MSKFKNDINKLEKKLKKTKMPTKNKKKNRNRKKNKQNNPEKTQIEKAKQESPNVTSLAIIKESSEILKIVESLSEEGQLTCKKFKKSKDRVKDINAQISEEIGECSEINGLHSNNVRRKGNKNVKKKSFNCDPIGGRNEKIILRPLDK